MTLKSPARVLSEPLTYTPHSGNSFFADLVRAQVRRDSAARERLTRHEREMLEWRTAEDKRAADNRRLLEALGVEMRINPSTTSGQGGEFGPPAWLISQFGTAATAGRVLADVIGSQPLPAGVSSIHIPRMTQGGTVAVQSGQAGAVSSLDEVTADANSPIVTISGEQDVSQSLFDQSPVGYDQVAYTDLSRNYNRALDSELFTGNGQSGRFLGLLNLAGNVPGANANLDGSGVTSFTLFWPMMGRLAATVGNARLLPAEHFFMAPRRWAWVASSFDSSNRPITSPGHDPSLDTPGLSMAGSTRAVGSMIGRKPVWEAGAIPAGTSADFVVACRPSEHLLFESAPRLTVNVEPDSGTLQVKIRMHRYVAYIPHRYPNGTSVLANIPQPANF